MDALPGSLPTIESLLEHADWVRGLARTLVRDPDRADDVVQETWLSALESPPRDATNPRGWLGAIVRNAVRQRARSDERRSAREAAAARTEAQSDTADLVARAALQRELVGHVLALEEPYRTTVLLRFFEGLEAIAIAERDAIPLSTVRSRLQRALELLRRRLDAEHGDRRAWMAALLPLTSARGLAPATAGSGTIAIVLGLAWKLSLIAAFACAIGWAAKSGMRAQSVEVVSTRSATEVPTLEPVMEVHRTDRTPVARASSTQATKPTSARLPDEITALGTITVRGLVIDPQGRPVPDLPLRVRELNVPYPFEADPIRIAGNPMLRWHWPRGQGDTLVADIATHGRTSRDGTFELEMRGQTPLVELETDEWILIGDGRASGRDERVHVAAPAITVSGIVVGEDGTPAAKACLSVSLSCEAMPDLPVALYGGNTWKSWTAESDDRGSFRFPAIASAGAASIVAKLGDLASESVRVPDHPADDVRVVLKRVSRPPRTILRGVVVDPNGAAVTGADVRLGENSCRSDEGGRFELGVSWVGEGTPLTATHPGHEAAVIEAFDQRFDLHSGGLDGIVLRLGGTPMTLGGRILDADGRPCAAWNVDLEDGTPFGSGSGSVEGATVGRIPRQEMAKSDAEGRFLLEGLRSRPYRVRVWSERECLVLIGDSVDAGRQDLEFRIPRDGRIPSVRGGVVGQRGEPVTGADVSVSFTLSNQNGAENFVRCKTVQTDSEGRFEIEDVPRRNAYLTVSSANLDEVRHFPIPTEDGSEVHIQANVVCRFRVELRSDDPADQFILLDEDGAKLFVTRYEMTFWDKDKSVPRGEKEFPVCRVSETAGTIVLLRGGVELRRQTIHLAGPDLQILQL